MSDQAIPEAPKLAWRKTSFAETAIDRRETNGAANAAAPRVFRKERRLNEGLMGIYEKGDNDNRVGSDQLVARTRRHLQTKPKRNSGVNEIRPLWSCGN